MDYLKRYAKQVAQRSRADAAAAREADEAAAELAAERSSRAE